MNCRHFPLHQAFNLWLVYLKISWGTSASLEGVRTGSPLWARMQWALVSLYLDESCSAFLIFIFLFFGLMHLLLRYSLWILVWGQVWGKQLVCPGSLRCLCFFSPNQQCGNLSGVVLWCYNSPRGDKWLNWEWSPALWAVTMLEYTKNYLAKKKGLTQLMDCHAVCQNSSWTWSSTVAGHRLFSPRTVRFI